MYLIDDVSHATLCFSPILGNRIKISHVLRDIFRLDIICKLLQNNMIGMNSILLYNYLRLCVHNFNDG